jgi:uncharacterized protein (DUF1684 family)
MNPTPWTAAEQLADYRRRVSELYAVVRQSGRDPQERWLHWRTGRDALFGTHPQSALDVAQKSAFSGLDYFPYDPALRLALEVETLVDDQILDVTLEEDGLFRMRRFGRVCFEVAGEPACLTLFWILGYGGGIFLPFRDTTNGKQTYGGGRYLLDTIKGADLGHANGRLVLDFNFSYNPSCAYNPRWVCPLAPIENWVQSPIRAGELAFLEEGTP